MKFHKKPLPGRAPEVDQSTNQSSVLLSLRQSLSRIRSNTKASKHEEIDGLIGKINGQLNHGRRKTS